MQRRKLVIRMIFQWLDGAILPLMRLALLLSCWARTDLGHGGGLALWMSGLSYQPRKQRAQTAFSTATSVTLPLFVLYAHRRWFQREALELLWNKIGRSLLVLQRETTEMGSSVVSSLVTEWRMKVVCWSYKLKVLLFPKTAIFPKSSESSIDDKKEPQSETEPCALCGTDKVVVPYRLSGCCGKVVCYVCLWDRLASNTALRKGLFSENIPCPICYQDISKCKPV